MRFEDVVAMATAAVLAVVLTAIARRSPAAAPALAARWGLAVVLAAVTAGYLVAEATSGERVVWDWLPLQLCDVAIFVAVWSLLTLQPLGAELVWFWGLTGGVLSMVLPNVAEGFPHWRWITFHVMHGGVAVSAIVLAFGLGVRPRPGAPWRVFGLSVLYAAGMAVLDLASDANFLFLKRKPAEHTLLDWFGPWPWYILVAAIVGLGLFHLLMLPFARRGRREAIEPALGSLADP